MRALVFSGIALIAAGGILFRKALRMSDPRRYRWPIPRPATPPGRDALPDDESWVQWQDPKAAEAEIAQIERDGRNARLLASRYSRVLPPELDAPLARDYSATTERDPPAQADPSVDVELAATALPVVDGEPRRYPADSRPSQRGNAMGGPERITTCWRCGLHIVPGKERPAGPDFWAEDPAGINSFDAEHLDCDPQALVDEFSDYIEELLVGDSSRIEAIREEVLPTLERLDELVPPTKRNLEEESKSGGD
jgi:hypothetical protein